MDFLGISDPRRVATLPLRPSRLAEEAMNREADIVGSTEDLMDTWNAWADCVERIFQQIGDQTKDLEVSDETYISFVRMIAAHPARPTPWPLENMTEYEHWLMKTMSGKYLAHLHTLWTAYADKLEGTHYTMAAELRRCNLLSSPFETTSTRGPLHGILRSMMGPGRSFQGFTDPRGHQTIAVAETGLQGRSIAHIASAMEPVSLSGAPATRMDVAEGLAVDLKKMSIEGDIS